MCSHKMAAGPFCPSEVSGIIWLLKKELFFLFQVRQPSKTAFPFNIFMILRRLHSVPLTHFTENLDVSIIFHRRSSYNYKRSSSSSSYDIKHIQLTFYMFCSMLQRSSCQWKQKANSIILISWWNRIKVGFVFVWPLTSLMSYSGVWNIVDTIFHLTPV